ncbi:MAG TPA: hypothetical protein VEC17_01880 [Candidatus Binatia bacterium]|nr:hypothetical protein [Candidatus Binatia bacterium]
MKKNHWLKKEVHLEKWLHKHLTFRDDKEFAIFLVWAMVVALLIYNVQ